MALKPVSDPNLIAALDGSAPAPTGPKPVTDPALLAALNGTAPPAPKLSDEVPAPQGSGQPTVTQPDKGVWGNFWDEVSGDPIVQMWGHGLKTAAVGAPETALTIGNNAVVQGIAGLTAPMVAGDPNDQANYIKDFTTENSYTPRGDSARQLTEGLGEAMSPYSNIQQGLGDATLEATGSPLAATGAHMLPDLGLALLGGEGLSNEINAPRAAKVTPRPEPISPTTQTARDMNVKLRPTDVQAANPGATVPGKTRQRFANQTELQTDTRLHNQQQMTGLALEELGAPGAAAIDDAVLDAAKAPHFANYKAAEESFNRFPPDPELAALAAEGVKRGGFKPNAAPSITQIIGALRRQSSKWIKSDVVATEQAGWAARELADSIEEGFGRHLEATGDADLFKAYQDSRMQLAKIHDIETATRAGQLDANVLKKLQDKDVPLSGRLKMMADVSEHFPDATKHSLSTASAGTKAPPRGLGDVIYEAAGAVGRRIPGVRDKIDVLSDDFQNSKFGAPASETERSYFPGRDVPEVTEAPMDPFAGLGDEGVPLEPTPGVVPTKASQLSRDLELAPDEVPNPQELPETPDMLTADVVPPVRGDIDFQASKLGDDMAGDLNIRSGVEGAIGEKELMDLLARQGAGDLEIAPPREMEQLDLPAAAEQPQRLSLAKSGPGKVKISGSGNQRTVRHADGGEIQAVVLPDQGVVQIKESQVPAGGRGQGRGQAMMEALRKENPGMKLWSGERVSLPAQKVWEALEKKGWKIKRNPATKQASGELVSKSELKPVFEVVEGPAETKAPAELGEALTAE